MKQYKRHEGSLAYKAICAQLGECKLDTVFILSATPWVEPLGNHAKSLYYTDTAV